MAKIDQTNPITSRAVALLRKYPDRPTLQLARMIVADMSGHATIGAARSAIGRLRGENIDKRWKTQTVVVPPRAKEARHAAYAHQWRVPEPDPSQFKIHDLPRDVSRWLVLSDIHVPYHDRRAVESAIEHGIREGCDGVLLNGDVMDCLQESRWEKDPTLRHLDGEVEMTGQLFDALRDAIKPKKFVWKFGNHERRHEAYIQGRAPELAAFQEFISLGAFLRCADRGIDVIDAHNIARLDELYIGHGHEVGSVMSNPVSPARGIYLRAGTFFLVGHGHQTSSHTKAAFGGEDVTCWSTGCLCDLHPTYRPVNPWNHGFCTVTADPWEVENWRVSSAGKVVRG